MLLLLFLCWLSQLHLLKRARGRGKLRGRGVVLRLVEIIRARRGRGRARGRAGRGQHAVLVQRGLCLGKQGHVLAVVVGCLLLERVCDGAGTGKEPGRLCLRERNRFVNAVVRSISRGSDGCSGGSSAGCL